MHMKDFLLTLLKSEGRLDLFKMVALASLVALLAISLRTKDLANETFTEAISANVYAEKAYDRAGDAVTAAQNAADAAEDASDYAESAANDSSEANDAISSLSSYLR